MFAHVKKLWEEISNVGTSSIPSSRNKEIRLTNQFALTIALVSSPFSILFLWYLGIYYFLMLLAISLLYLLPIFFNYFQHHFFAKMWFLVYDLVIIYSLSLILGKDSGMYLAFFPSSFLPFLIFEKKYMTILTLLSIFTVLLGLSAWLEIGGDLFFQIELEEDVESLYHGGMILAVFTATFFFIGVYVSDNRQYIRELQFAIHQKDVAEKETAIALKKAEATSEAKGRFLAIMSHEIRTPISAIIGFSQLLEHQKDEFSAKHYAYISSIKISGEQLLGTINNILDLSKIESGNIKINNKDFEFATLIKDIYNTHQLKAAEKNIQFQLDLSPQLPRFVKGDRQMLGQVIINLVSNALKYTPEGGKVRLNTDYDGESLIIEVVDTGQGISEEKQDMIFQAFNQVDNSLCRENEGTGLGLTIVKTFVELLGGTISVKSCLGEGASFTVKLPFISADVCKTNKNLPNIQHRFANDQVILMVEDNRVNQMVCKALFETMALKLHFAINGQEGIEKAKELKPDLIFMDLHMPIMNGSQAITHLRQLSEFKNTPIVILSADVFNEFKQAQLDVNDYLTKPLEIDSLQRVLEKYLKKQTPYS